MSSAPPEQRPTAAGQPVAAHARTAWQPSCHRKVEGCCKWNPRGYLTYGRYEDTRVLVAR
eukprot:7270736-Prymnesium_polylepis.1